MIGLAEKLPKKDENHELHRFLGTLVSEKLGVYEKIDILENEYHIPMEKSLEEDVKIMCNLSEGIEERAMEIGREAGIELARNVFRLKNQGLSNEQISEELHISVETVDKVIGE